MAKLEWTPEYFIIYIINKSFFTLLSITTKWINLWIKKFASTRNWHQFVTTRVILHKKQKNIRESRKRNMFLKCLCPHVGCVTQ